MENRPDITELLRRWSEGGADSLDRLFPIVYDQLRRLAHRRVQNERAGHTLNTTALVHEAYLKFVDMDRVNWTDRAHFFALASRVMRHLLVDYGRRRMTAKRGGNLKRMDLDEERLVSDDSAEKLLDLDEALTRLSALQPRSAQALEQCYFGGMTAAESAAVLGVSRATVERDLRFARTWLARHLESDAEVAELNPDQDSPGE